MGEGSLPAKVRLKQWLNQRIQSPHQASEIDASIHAAFAETLAIVVVDMSGFSRTTERYGILHFLTMIVRLEAIARPIIPRYQGTLIKQEADNLLIIFPQPAPALAAMVELLSTLQDVNAQSPQEDGIYIGIGMGYGEVLRIGNEDIFGSEMNIASKLGEDLARPGEILLTQAAFQHLGLGVSPGGWEKLEFSISGLHMIGYRAPESVRRSP